MASKMPGHVMHYQDGRLGFAGYLSDLPVSSPADIFEEQLEKCGVAYFDFYLLHNLCETAYDLYTDEDLGVVEYLLAHKAGRIHHLGFSAHARAETIDAFLNWKDCFEFVQIQLNCLDWTLQDAKRKCEVITNHGIPVITMESVRGGRLASLSEQAEATLKAVRPDASIASWAFRFLQSLSNVQVVLSFASVGQDRCAVLHAWRGGRGGLPAMLRRCARDRLFCAVLRSMAVAQAIREPRCPRGCAR